MKCEKCGARFAYMKSDFPRVRNPKLCPKCNGRVGKIEKITEIEEEDRRFKGGDVLEVKKGRSRKKEKSMWDSEEES